jgi:hypothetical protein
MFQARKVNVPSQESECTKPGKLTIMYIAVSIFHSSMIFRVDFGTVCRLCEMYCFKFLCEIRDQFITLYSTDFLA